MRFEPACYAGPMFMQKLARVVTGNKPGRIIFDSTGMALEDVAGAALVYEKAAQAGFERTVEFAV